MDTSETYIKMCEKAEKIQAKWERLIGDFAYNYEEGKLRQGIKRGVNYIVCGQTWGKDVWLPRQDQLQETSGLDWVTFDDKCRCYYFQDARRETTKEQAGIQVVMNEKYNKTWDGEKWQEK